MSVVNMKKMSFIGMKADREEILNTIMNMGAVHLNENFLTDENEDTESSAQKELLIQLNQLEDEKREISLALKTLSHYNEKKKPLFKVKNDISRKEYEKILKNSDTIRNTITEVLDLNSNLNENKNKKNALEDKKAELSPWDDFLLPLELKGTKKTTNIIGTIPGMIIIDDVEEELSKDVECSIFENINTDSEQHYIHVIVHNEEIDKTKEILRRNGFTGVSFLDLEGTVSENINKINNSIIDIKNSTEEIKEKLKELSLLIPKIEAWHDNIVILADKVSAIMKMEDTSSTFVFEGWLPEKISDKIKKVLEDNWICMVELKDPLDEEKFPVLLENNYVSASMEPVTQMYSLPDCREADPNTIMAPFFIMFFGLMLSDAGYGIIMALASALILRKVKLEDKTKKMIRMFMFCGFATIFWGALFGGWFGNLIPMIMGDADKDIFLWFNPLKNPELLLAWSLLFGVVHLFVGLAMRGYNLFKRKKYLDILFDVVVWYVFYLGAIFFALPYVPAVDVSNVPGLVNSGQYLLLIGGVLLLLTQGRNSKNIFGRIIKGLSSLYDLIGFLSDVLSYSRLLAMGLATSVIASIVNELGWMFGSGIVRVLIFIFVFLLGHSFNFAINALSAYVHSSRLQYVEFFNKFYTGGGKAFSPFKTNTKYINIEKQEGIKNV